ncbi:MAG TPA: type II toxin-antitoxin system YafQ family toxin [Gemmatimonadales bacterium]|jgi:mRNA interferase YafQ
MLRPRATSAFKKDWKRAARRGKDLDTLDALMRRLANEEQLEPRFRDHKLSGEWQGFRECHVEPDWLLIYRIEGDEITFVRTGTHADLFDE